MVKHILPAIGLVIFLSSCSALKTLNISSNKQTTSVEPRAKFIDEIIITPKAAIDKTEINSGPRETFSTPGIGISESQLITEEAKHLTEIVASRSTSIESASPVQLKYAVLLNTEVEYLPNKTLLESVDSWYGVRYRTGGNGKSGIDCSGFTVAVYAAAYGINLPRVSREQYRISRKISTTELKEGDLLFFNTRGSGISHVGVYLGNNKFIHATVSKGVMVNGLFESYYVKRFIGAGRIDDKQLVASN